DRAVPASRSGYIPARKAEKLRQLSSSACLLLRPAQFADPYRLFVQSVLCIACRQLRPVDAPVQIVAVLHHPRWLCLVWWAPALDKRRAALLAALALVPG